MLTLNLHRNITVRSAPIDLDPNRPWLQILAAAILSACLYAFYEWKFFINQPSSTSGAGEPQISAIIVLFSWVISAGESIFINTNLFGNAC